MLHFLIYLDVGRVNNQSLCLEPSFHILRGQSAVMISHWSLTGVKSFQKIEQILGDSPYDMELQHGLQNKLLRIIS